MGQAGAKSLLLPKCDKLTSLEEAAKIINALISVVDEMHRKLWGDVDYLQRDAVPAAMAAGTAYYSAEIPFLEGFAFSYNGGTNVISWSAGIIRYRGTSYTIATGSSDANDTWLYWDAGDSALTHTAAAPGLDMNLWIMGFVDSADHFHQVVQNYLMHAGLLQADTVTATQIAAETITSVEIAAGTITVTQMGTTEHNAITGSNAGLTTTGYLKRSVKANDLTALTPSTTGLYLTPLGMGYYSSVLVGWGVYIGATGNFYFSGNVSNYIEWDGSTMDMKASKVHLGNSDNYLSIGFGTDFLFMTDDADNDQVWATNLSSAYVKSNQLYIGNAGVGGGYGGLVAQISGDDQVAHENYVIITNYDQTHYFTISDDSGVFRLRGFEIDHVSVIGFSEQVSSPSKPADGEAIIWLAEGTGLGDAGDVMIASKVGATTRYATLFDYSSGAEWV